MEETGLVVEITGLRGLYFGAGDPRGSSHLAVFSAKRHQGTPIAGDDAADVLFADAAALDALDCTPRLVETLREWGVLPR
jgi:hypothetical protein